MEEIKYNILFLDIETVPLVYDYKTLGNRAKNLWETKVKNRINKECPAEELYKKAGIFSEFGKIVCISLAFIINENGKDKIRITSFSNDDESEILKDFKQVVDKKINYRLCAHNGKEFDFPFLARRYLINGLKLPLSLDIAGKKPWEIKHLDTMELWKFGDYKNYTSLDLLAHVFDISSPKDEMSGADVARVYWQENNLSKIVEYCQRDVVTLIQVYLRLIGETCIEQLEYK